MPSPDSKAAADRLRANAYPDTPEGRWQRTLDLEIAINFFLAAHPPISEQPCEEIEDTPGACDLEG